MYKTGIIVSLFNFCFLPFWPQQVELECGIIRKNPQMSSLPCDVNGLGGKIFLFTAHVKGFGKAIFRPGGIPSTQVMGSSSWYVTGVP